MITAVQVAVAPGAADLIRAAHGRLLRAVRTPAVHGADRLGPVSQLVYVLLQSGSLSDQADAAFRALTSAFWDWDSALRGGLRRIHEYTGPLDPSGAKARTIIGALGTIAEWSRGGHLSLRILSDMTSDQAIELLQSIEGVSAAMAAEVLLVSSMHRRVLPVDFARLRVLARLGAIRCELRPVDAQRVIGKILPQEWRPADCERDFYASRVLARSTCLPRGPRCGHCPLADICAHARRSPAA